MTVMELLPDTLLAERALAAATILLEAGPGPARARTVVRLLRHSLEIAVDAYWEATRPGEVVGHSGRGRQIRLLAATIDRCAAHEVYATWCRLSDAAKPHPYELSPGIGELRCLHAATERQLATLAFSTSKNQ